MKIRYDRALTVPLADLKVGGAFNFLISDLPLWNNDRYAFDVQIRENNKLMYYHGTTCLLTVKLVVKKGCLQVRMKSGAYANKVGCADEYASLNALNNRNDGVALRNAFHAYLLAAAQASASKYYGKNQKEHEHKEGYWQNRLCIAYGREWTPDAPWLVIDRECVIGFNKDSQNNNPSDDKDEYINNTIKPYLGIRKELQNLNKDKWGKDSSKSLGDELDLLALRNDGKLLAVELKHGGNVSGIYWGPLQACAYRDMFSGSLSSIAKPIAVLIKQKIELGLLPKEAMKILDKADFKDIYAVLAVGAPKTKDSCSCWRQMEEVYCRLKAVKPDSGLNLSFSHIRDINGYPTVEAYNCK